MAVCLSHRIHWQPAQRLPSVQYSSDWTLTRRQFALNVQTALCYSEILVRQFSKILILIQV